MSRNIRIAISVMLLVLLGMLMYNCQPPANAQANDGPIINGISPKSEGAIGETVLVTGTNFTSSEFSLPEHMLMMEFDDDSVEILADRQMTTIIKSWTDTQIAFEVQPNFVVDLEGCLRVVVGNRQSNCLSYTFYKDETDPLPGPDVYKQFLVVINR